MPQEVATHNQRNPVFLHDDYAIGFFLLSLNTPPLCCEMIALIFVVVVLGASWLLVFFNVLDFACGVASSSTRRAPAVWCFGGRVCFCTAGAKSGFFFAFCFLVYLCNCLL
jgi:hypothetical protein